MFQKIKQSINTQVRFIQKSINYLQSKVLKTPKNELTDKNHKCLGQDLRKL